MCYIASMHMLTGLIFQPRPFTPFQLSWYLFIMTIDTSPLCLYKVSESIYILHKMLLWVLTTATVRGLLSFVHFHSSCFSVYTFNQWVVSEWIYIHRLVKKPSSWHQYVCT